MKKLGLLLLAVMMISLSSCGGDDAKKAKEGAEKAVEATKDAAKEATNDVEEATEKAADEVKEGAEKAADAVKDTAKETSSVDGKTLFMNNGCIACHQMDKKTVGPSVKEIGAAYAGKKDDLIKFLKGEGKAIVDPAQFAVMQPNLATTKNMNDAELSALADYFLNAK
jgi:cytochrome c